MRRDILPMMALSVLIVHCDIKSEEDKASSNKEGVEEQNSSAFQPEEPLSVSGFLKEENLAQPTLFEQTLADEIPSEVSEIANISALAPKSAPTDQENDAYENSKILSADLCPDSFWQGAQIKVNADNVLIIDHSVSKYTCVIEPDPMDELSTQGQSEVVGKYFLVLYCKDTDLSKYDGKSPQELLTDLKPNICGADPLRQEFSQYYIQSSNIISFNRLDGVPVTIREAGTIAGAMQDSQGRPCITTVADGKAKRNDCLETYVSTTDLYERTVTKGSDNQEKFSSVGKENNAATFSKITYENTVFDLASKSYTGGKLIFSKNGWAGQIDFDNEFSWNAVKGEETLEGKLSETAQ